MLTGQELKDAKIVTGDIKPENIAQHGIDLNLIKVQRMLGVGRVPKIGKTELVSYHEVQPVSGWWHLEPGAYDITLAQGCDIPADKMLLIRQRSSLLRNGSILHSSVFDAGFKTENIGTVLVVTHPIEIEVGARVCQIYAHDSNEVKNLYDGQFQGDSQRKDEGGSL